MLYTAELELIVTRHGLRLHMYTDDCQVYLNTSVEDVPLAVSKFSACVADINACHNVLVLAISDTARDLGVVIDHELSLAAHVTASVVPVTTSYASSDQ